MRIDQDPPIIWACASRNLRPRLIIMPIAWSATEASLPPAAIVTTRPRSLAACRSTRS